MRRSESQWEDHRFQYLTDPEADASITLDKYHEQIEELQAELAEPQADGSLPQDRLHLLDQLLEYSDSLLA